MKPTTDEVTRDYLLRAPHNYQINSPLNSDFGDIEVKAGKGDSMVEQQLKMLQAVKEGYTYLKCLLSCFPIYHNW